MTSGRDEMTAMDDSGRHVIARYARLAALCRKKAETADSRAVAKELGELADAYDRRRLRLI